MPRTRLFDPLLVMDVVMGTLINRWLASGRAPTPSESAMVVDILLNGITDRPGDVASKQRRGAVKSV